MAFPANNLFGPFGYQDAGFDLTSEVSLTYYAGIPTFSEITDSNLLVPLRSLLKRDAKTLQRGLQSLLEYVQQSTAATDAEARQRHLVVTYKLPQLFCQIYAKLSIDQSPDVRRLAHQCLGAIFAVLQRKSQRYLKLILGLWLAGTHDPDPLVAEAAQQSWELLFNDQAKQTLARLKLRSELVAFVVDVIENHNASTISDPRLVSLEDAAFKYNRLLCTTIDLLSHDILAEAPASATAEAAVAEAATAELDRLLNSQRLWRLVTSTDPLVASKLLLLAETHVSVLAQYSLTIWSSLTKSILQVHPLAAAQLLKTLLALEHTGQERAWSPEMLNQLAQLAAKKEPRPAQFWRSLHSLALSLSLSDESNRPQVLAKVSRAIAKALANPRLAAPAEYGAWECFVSLSLKSGLNADISALVLQTMARRLDAPRVPKQLLFELANHLQRLNEATPSLDDDLSAAVLDTADVHIKACFIVILAYCKNLYLSEPTYLKLLTPPQVIHESLKIDATIELPINDAVLATLSPGDATELLAVAKNPTVITALIQSLRNSQQGRTELIKRAPELRPAIGNNPELYFGDGFAIPSTPQDLCRFVRAAQVFVSQEQAARGLLQLLNYFVQSNLEESLDVFEQLMSDEDLVRGLMTVAETMDPEFVELKTKFSSVLSLAKSLLTAPTKNPLNERISDLQAQRKVLAALAEFSTWQTIPHLIELLGSTLSRDCLEVVIQLASDVSSVWLRATTDQKNALLLKGTNWVPQESLTLPPDAIFGYDIRWQSPPIESSAHHKAWKHALFSSIYLLHLSLNLEGVDVVIDDALALEIHLTKSAAKGHVFSGDIPSTLEDTRYFLDLYGDHPFEGIQVNLDLIMGSDITPRQFHLAQLYFKEFASTTDDFKADLLLKHESVLRTPCLLAALLSSFGDCAKPPSYDRFQQSLYSSLARPTFSLINLAALFDPTVNPVKLRDALIPCIARESGLDKVALLYLLADVEKFCYEQGIELAEPDSDLFANYTSDPLLLLAAVKTSPYNCPLQFVLDSFAHIQFADNCLHDTLSCAIVERLWPLRTHAQDVKFDMDRLMTQLKALDATGVEGGSFASNYAWAIYLVVMFPIREQYIKLLEEAPNTIEMPPQVGFLLEGFESELTTISQEIGSAIYLRCIDEYTNITKTATKHMPPASIKFAQSRPLIEAMLKLCESKLKLVNADTLEWNRDFRPNFREDVVAGGMLYKLASNFGSAVQKWFRNLSDRALAKNVLHLFTASITPVIVADVAQDLAALQEQGIIDRVSSSNNNRDIKTLIDLDGHDVSINISLSDCFPLKQSSLEIKGIAGVPSTKLRSWQLDASKSISDGRVVNALLNVRDLFQDWINGFEPCVICYAVVLENKSLPRISCSTCSNNFHSECLHEWFSTSKSKECPMCRTTM